MDILKLAALDPDDLAIIAAHLQDAIVRTGDLTFLPGERRFALVARRFDWQSPPHEPRRRLTGLHFDHVRAARRRGIAPDAPDGQLDLLTITFAETDAPSGMVELVFAGGASVQLDVECVEVQMKDLGPAWAAETRPSHEGSGG